MGDLSYRVEQTCTAPPSAVYAVLADLEGWPGWMPTVRRAAWESGQGGVEGAIRRVGGRGMYAREQVIVADPPQHHAYAILSGAPVRDYRADVHIGERIGGSLITWEANFRSPIPGVGWLLQSVLSAAIKKVALALAREAEHRHRRT
jgi:hypothetical protein